LIGNPRAWKATRSTGHKARKLSVAVRICLEMLDCQTVSEKLFLFFWEICNIYSQNMKIQSASNYL